MGELFMPISQLQQPVNDETSMAFTLREQPMHANRHLRVMCVGAGASGLCLAYKLKHYFTDFTLNIYEKNEDIGGTWFENRYPGCACDIPA
jgi:cation diffusion facilitator CzcD-associated flavoprotein CzcO